MGPRWPLGGWSILAAVVLVAGVIGGLALGTRSPSEGPTLGPVSTPAASDPSQTDAPTTTVDPNTSIVATARPTLRSPAFYDAPDGETVDYYEPVTNPTYFGSPLTLLVTEGSPDDEWVRVQVPVRPNGTEAWVRSAGYTFAENRFRARITLGEHRVQVWSGDEEVLDTEAVIGADATPTPLGTFYVNDRIPREDPGGAYGPYILSLSGYSEVLETFNGGLPVLAIHGTNRPDLIGSSVSNGCVRIPNDLIVAMAEYVPVGTPVDIVA